MLADNTKTNKNTWRLTKQFKMLRFFFLSFLVFFSLPILWSPYRPAQQKGVHNHQKKISVTLAIGGCLTHFQQNTKKMIRCFNMLAFGFSSKQQIFSATFHSHTHLIRLSSLVMIFGLRWLVSFFFCCYYHSRPLRFLVFVVVVTVVFLFLFLSKMITKQLQHVCHKVKHVKICINSQNGQMFTRNKKKVVIKSLPEAWDFFKENFGSSLEFFSRVISVASKPQKWLNFL